MSNIKKIIQIIALSSLFVPVTTALAAESWDKPGYTLVAHDEFDTPVIDNGKWFRWYMPHWTTREQSVSNYTVEGGKLVLKIERDSVPWDPKHDGETIISGVQTANKEWLHKWTSAYTGIENEEPVIENHLQKYGYFEIRAKTQSGGGIHSAWWMIGFQEDGTTWDDSHQTNEVDIFEVLGRNPNEALFNNHSWTDPDTNEISSAVNLGFDSSADFNIYGFEWNETNMKLYVNNVLRQTLNTTVHYPMLTLLGLYEKRHGGWTGPFDPNVQYPKRFEIDYWRAYQRNDMIHTNNEAEHAKMSGYATTQSNASASNARVVGLVGNSAESYLEYKNVWINVDGVYSLGIDYFSGENRDLYVKVNNGTPIHLIDLNSGGWSNVSRAAFNAVLLKGNNTIKLYNENGYTPDIDRLTITAIDNPINLALLANVSASNIQDIEKVKDENLTTAVQSSDAPSFPQDITFSWLNEQSPSVIKFATYYGLGQGVTLVDIQKSSDGTTGWTTVVQDAEMLWKSNGGNVEWNYISFPGELGQVKGLRVVIKSSNLTWNHYAINEIIIN